MGKFSIILSTLLVGFVFLGCDGATGDVATAQDSVSSNKGNTNTRTSNNDRATTNTRTSDNGSTTSNRRSSDNGSATTNRVSSNDESSTGGSSSSNDDSSTSNSASDSLVKEKTGEVQNFKVRKGRMVQEYDLTMNLVSTITAQTINSGNWSDSATWENGVIPGEGARVLINKNHKVVINKELNTRLRTIKVEGELAFNPHKNTRLIFDTMLTTPDSILRIGEPSIPIDSQKTATLIIHDYNGEGMITNNPASPDYDPLRIGQGMIVNGLFLAHGEEKTPYAALRAKGVRKNKNTIEVDEDITGWHVGDDIIVLGTSETGTQSESFKIDAINGRRITLDSTLKYDHLVAKTTIQNAGMKVHVANLTRNIIIRTSADAIAGRGDKNNVGNVEHRGHILFMHTNNININYMKLLDLGRTNKKFPLDETTFTSESSDAKVTHMGTNQAARYAIHFHRAGLNNKIGHVNGCVVYESPGWGYVNHSSNVQMKENIAYHVYGASFITEAGDEVGTFEGNMAIETRGVGRSNVKGWGSRSSVGDGGFQGNGFWIIGPHVKFVDNIVNGSSNAAFAFNHGTIDSVTGVVFDDDKVEHTYKDVSLKSFVGNVAYANSGGVFGILGGTRGGANEHINDLLAWNNAPMSNNELIAWWYPSDVTMKNITLINDIDNPKYIGIGTQTKLRKTILEDLKIEGMEVGLRVPSYVGENIIKNVYLNNLVNMLYIAATTNKGADTKIEGDIKYGTLPGNQAQTNMKFTLKVRDVSWKNYWDRQFNTYNIIYAPTGETAMKLYMTNEQSPNFTISVGDNKGKSNSDLIAQGHKPVGGVLLPSNAVEMTNMTNVSGAPIE